MVTLHRHWLFEHDPLLATALDRLVEISDGLPVVFAMHPRTQAAIEALGYRGEAGLHLLPALGYLEFLGLMSEAAGS